MNNPEVANVIKQFFISVREDRKDPLMSNINSAINNLSSRNMFHSSIAVQEISKIFVDELKFRFGASWKNIKEYFDRKQILFSNDDIKEINDLLMQLVNDEIRNLTMDVERRFKRLENILDFQNSIKTAIASTNSIIYSIISADMNIYTDTELTPTTNIKENHQKLVYVDNQRLLELRSLNNSNYDPMRLIKLCEEINSAYQNDCYMTIAMILRTIIDHVPPIFNKTSFPEIANNYSAAKSFKELMLLLDQQLRKVADSHLHVQIRNVETLPSFSQVDFRAPLDALLGEIVRILKGDQITSRIVSDNQP